MTSAHCTVNNVHMIILMQPNLQAAIDFYEQLGLKLVFQIKDRWAEMKLGNVKIGLCPTTQHIDGFRTGIVLQTADLLALYNTHKNSISFLNEPKEATHGLMVSFKDPGGNIIDLYQPTPEKVTELVKKVAQTPESDDNDYSKESCARKDQCCRSNKDTVGHC